MTARLSPQREAEPSRRDDLLKILRLGSAHSERSANYLLDTFAAEVREQAEAELAAVRAELAALKQRPAVEYGVEVQGDEVADSRVLDPTPDLAEARERLARYSDVYAVRLVQRTVHHGEWTEVAS